MQKLGKDLYRKNILIWIWIFCLWNNVRWTLGNRNLP